MILDSDNKQCWPELICEAIENSGKGIIVINSKNKIIQINDLAKEWTELDLGMDVGDLIGKSLIQTKNRDMIKIKFGKAENNTLVYFLSKRNTYSNVSDDKLVEYEKLFDQLYDDYLLTDAEGRILGVRGVSELTWGINGGEIMGKKMSEIKNCESLFPSTITKTLETGKKSVANYTSFIGNTFISTSMPLFDELGNISRIVTVSQDVSKMSYINERIQTVEEMMNFYRERMFEMYQNIDSIMIVGDSEEKKTIDKLILKAASVNSTVLLLGESGVGKDLIARNIHELSSRKEHAFVKINCGAIPGALLESELFGYDKGAFTGANSQGKEGLLHTADKGTLFLDEVGDMPLELQVKILEVIQDRLYKKVGSTESISVDVRIIAATHQDLEKMVEDNQFRLDLFYRLNVFPIEVLPLRQRRKDIGVLCKHFVMHFNSVFNKNITITKEAIECLEQHDWPGNVRQLANTLERLMILTEKDEIDVNDIDREVCRQMQRVNFDEDIQVNRILPWKTAIDQLADKLFMLTYQQYKSTTKAAKVLEVNQSTVVRRLKKAAK